MKRKPYAQMSRCDLGTLHGLISDAWRTLHQIKQTALADIPAAAREGANNLHAALKIIEKKMTPLE